MPEFMPNFVPEDSRMTKPLLTSGEAG
jgi:hypothetical protein